MRGLVNYASVGTAWRHEWRDKAFRAEAILSFVVLCAVIRLSSLLLVYTEQRHGAHLVDPFLSNTEPIRLTWLTFSVLWLSLFFALYSLLPDPRRLAKAVQAGTLILAFRSITIYLIPLEPLATIIPLNDPLIEYFGAGQRLVKDLLFSGHTSLMFLLCFSARKTWLTVLFLIAALTVAAGVVLQHVHYSGDVFIAPFFAYTSWRITCVLHDKLGPRPVGATPV